MKAFYIKNLLTLLLLCLNVLSGSVYAEDSIFDFDSNSDSSESDLISFTGGNGFNLEKSKRKDNDIISRIFKKGSGIKKSAVIRVRVVEISNTEKTSDSSQIADSSLVQKTIPETDKTNEQINDLYSDKLSDVSRKLATLPFKYFRVVSDTYIEAPINQVKNLKLIEDHNLAIKPLYFHDNKLCVQLDWKDQSGVQILDSQLHFKIGESIIAGSESSEEKGLLLILNAEKQ